MGRLIRRMPFQRLNWCSSIQSREVAARLGRPLAQACLRALESRRKMLRTEVALGSRTRLSSSRRVTSSEIYGLALGYEDLNDQGRLRLDPLLAKACDKDDPLGQDRFNPTDQGIALAAPSTLNRLELSNNKQSRCHKLPDDPQQLEACLLKLGVRVLPKQATRVVVDLDAMGNLVHRMQEGRHFHGYYGDY
jgi:hypothetical protein